ncbi:MAG: cytochrome c biogenesis protein CcdA [bacterium]
MELPVSFGLAFVAGLVSFLSPCVLPLVPSYVTFVTGMTLDDLAGADAARGRARAARHAAAFVFGFILVFLALGATASVAGPWLRHALPLLQQIGGALVVLFGFYLIGWPRPRWMMRDTRVHLADKPAGLGGSIVVGIAFGAGWTPCVGPVLASILLYAGAKSTLIGGMLLLAVYGLGLGIPFFVAAVAFNWYLAGATRVRRWLRPIEIAAGVLLIVVGTMLVSGHFARLTRVLADFGQLVNIQR